jgi:hypothetical protein
LVFGGHKAKGKSKLVFRIWFLEFDYWLLSNYIFGTRNLSVRVACEAGLYRELLRFASRYDSAVAESLEGTGQELDSRLRFATVG